jgi:hypothetical protein
LTLVPKQEKKMVKKEFCQLANNTPFVYGGDHFVTIPDLKLSAHGHTFIVNAIQIHEQEDEWCPTKFSVDFFTDKTEVLVCENDL